MFGIEFSMTLLIGIAIGAVGALTLEHGWGWVLARYRADAAKTEAAFNSHVAKVSIPLEQRLQVIEGKLGIPSPAAAPAVANPSPSQAAPAA